MADGAQIGIFYLISHSCRVHHQEFNRGWVLGYPGTYSALIFYCVKKYKLASIFDQSRL